MSNDHDDYEEFPAITSRRQHAENEPFYTDTTARRGSSARPNSSQPMYVKHAYPEIFREKKDYHNYLPKLPQLHGGDGAAVEQCYGLMYHRPESAAEVKMNDLWVSKRREEAYAWKSKQQMTLMLDRMSLHRSRLEADLLTRYDTFSFSLTAILLYFAVISSNFPF